MVRCGAQRERAREASVNLDTWAGAGLGGWAGRQAPGERAEQSGADLAGAGRYAVPNKALPIQVKSIRVLRALGKRACSTPRRSWQLKPAQVGTSDDNMP